MSLKKLLLSNIKNRPWHYSRYQSSLAVSAKLVPFKLTDIGEGIAEVELLKWFVKEGDVIRSFDRVCEVQSDKATVEITSRYGGIVKIIHHEEGAIVKVGSSLVDIETVSDTIAPEDDFEAVRESPSSIQGGLEGQLPSFSREARLPLSYDREKSNSDGSAVALPQMTPAVRRLAKEMNLNLLAVKGSGPGGRILKEDLYLFSDTDSANSGTAAVNSTHREAISSAAPERFLPLPSLNHPIEGIMQETLPLQKGGQRIVPLRGVQRLMARSMAESLKVPQLTFSDDIDCDKLMRLKEDATKQKQPSRSQNQDQAGSESRSRASSSPSIMPFLVKATSLALKRHPIMNCSVLCPDCSEVVYNDDHNIGIAMDTPKGLLVPVIRHVQLKSISQIAAELSDLQAKALAGTLSERDMQGGTFTLSNIGSIGGVSAVPLVLVPQVAIGALGRMRLLPRYASHLSGADGPLLPVPTRIMTVSWSADHRIVDGASVARFSNTWKGFIEAPSSMLQELV